MQSNSNSINELLQLFKHLKITNSEIKSKQSSTISLLSKNYSSNHNRQILDTISLENLQNISSKSNQMYFKKNFNVFDKLYSQGKSMDIKKCRIQYQTRRSKEEKQRTQCTFSPNIGSRFKIKTQYDSVQGNSSVYQKNIEWLQRKQKSIRKMQCQKNQQNACPYTFTPRINKMKKVKNKDNAQNNKIQNFKGVYGHLDRQEKAHKKIQYIKQRQKNPYSHVWNIKRGYFSYVK